MLEETKQRVATKGIELAVGPRLLERIIQDGYSLEYGVRPLRQVSIALRMRRRMFEGLLCVSMRLSACAQGASVQRGFPSRVVDRCMLYVCTSLCLMSDWWWSADVHADHYTHD